MKAWAILGYTYMADHHCVSCAIAARDAGKLTCEQYAGHAGTPETGEDDNGLAYGLADKEGNLIHPIFASDEPPLREDGSCAGVWCGACGAELVAPSAAEA